MICEEWRVEQKAIKTLNGYMGELKPVMRDPDQLCNKRILEFYFHCEKEGNENEWKYFYIDFIVAFQLVFLFVIEYWNIDGETEKVNNELKNGEKGEENKESNK